MVVPVALVCTLHRPLGSSGSRNEVLAPCLIPHTHQHDVLLLRR